MRQKSLWRDLGHRGESLWFTPAKLWPRHIHQVIIIKPFVLTIAIINIIIINTNGLHAAGTTCSLESKQLCATSTDHKHTTGRSSLAKNVHVHANQQCKSTVTLQITLRKS